MSTRERIVSRGRFSLRAAAEFGFGPNEGRAPVFEGEMRLAFPLDGGAGHAGAVLTQPHDDGPVEVELSLRGDGISTGGGDGVGPALDQVARILSLDHDGEGFAALGERDPVLGALQAAHPGQRPVLFPSPYEAAAWSALSARRPAAQGARVREALGAELGETFSLAGTTQPAFPQAARLAELRDGFPGLDATKIERLRAVGAAALAGDLDVARIHALGPEAAYRELQRLPGIGPFYASLIVLRASGFADAWLGPAPGHRGEDPMTTYYGPLTAAETAGVVEGWRPFRTWALVLLRLAAVRGTRI